MSNINVQNAGYFSELAYDAIGSNANSADYGAQVDPFNLPGWTEITTINDSNGNPTESVGGFVTIRTVQGPQSRTAIMFLKYK